MGRLSRLCLALLVLITALIAGGCQGLIVGSENGVTVTLVSGDTSRTLMVSNDLTVADVLRQSGITLGDLDRVNPPSYTRVVDGMTITVVRVVEQTAIEQETVPFQSRTVPNDSLPAGQSRLLQAGVNGIAEVTYRITFEDGIEVSRNEIKRVVITPPQDEVIMVGSQGELPTVTVNGTLAYISNGNAWIMRQNSANRRPLTLDGAVDGRVFELSSDGRRLLFTRTLTEVSAEGSGLATAVPDTAEPGQPFNTLWVVFDTTDPDSPPIRLDLENILFAAWVPGTERTLVYSTAEPRAAFPGWQANNDLWRAHISANGGIVQRQMLLEPSSGGIYGWFGTTFAFAPDGVTMAWAQPDAVGILAPDYSNPAEEVEEGTPTPHPTPTPIEPGIPSSLLPRAYFRQTLATFAPWNPYDFVWRPNVSWSPEGRLFVTTVHGAPLGSELAEDSPIFSLTTFSADGSYSVNLVEQAGMWAEPSFSPGIAPDGTPLPVQMAYLQALDPLSSTYSRYRLVVMDRDGSNRRAIYPPADRAGLLAQVYAWSPDGRQIALIDPGPEGNLFLVDVFTGLSQQLTLDGQSSNPRWAP